MRRGDPDRIYRAKRAGFLARLVSERRLTQERAEVVLMAVEAEIEAEGIEADSPEWHRERERRALG